MRSREKQDKEKMITYMQPYVYLNFKFISVLPKSPVNAKSHNYHKEYEEFIFVRI